MAGEKNIGDNRPAGLIVAQNATALLGFYGKAPAAQPATIAAVGTTGSASTTNAYGFTTAAQADAVITTLNSVVAALKTLGLIAT